MLDIFISYSRDDIDLAKQLEEKLNTHGWRVWFDSHIRGGSNFREEIVENLQKARCVIVIWTPNSITSNFVIDEAGEATSRLIPIITCDVKPPMGFRNFHSVKCKKRDKIEEEEFKELINKLTEKLGHPRFNKTPNNQKHLKQFDEFKTLLIPDIEDGKCVLFLGPELLVSKEGKYYKSYFKDFVSENLGRYKYFYFENENLFSFTQNSAAEEKEKLIQKFQEFYLNAGDDAFLNLISQIPFSLIINFAPDAGISKVFKNNNYEFNSAYFSEHNKKEVKAPSINNPLIYNIFGSVEDTNSLIITPDDLYNRIKALMQKGSLPYNLIKFLHSANSLIFVGINFDVWYYRVLLHILEIEAFPFLSISAGVDMKPETLILLNSFFHMAVTQDRSLNLIQTIYDELAVKEDILRKIIVEQSKGFVYMSYAWDDENSNRHEDFLDLIQNELSKETIKVLKKKSRLTLEDDIRSFINRIGKGKVFVIVITDRYLKSEYCMYEAWEIFKNNDLRDTTFIAIQNDVDLTEIGKSNYLKFWIEKFKAIPELNYGNLEFSKLKLAEQAKYTYLFISEFINLITETTYYTVPGNLDSDNQATMKEFKNFISAIIKKLK